MKAVYILIILVVVMIGAYSAYGTLAKKASAEKQPPAAAPAAPAGPAEKAPDFTVTGQNGDKVSFSSMLGKPVIVNIWATWCGPCKMELPDFQEASQKYSDRITFMMVNLTSGDETVDTVRKFLRENSYTFPVYFDTEQSADGAYQVTGIPTTIFIDAEGNIVSKQIGMLDREELQAGIDRLLAAR
ncbi:MAG: TlpA family protein disulfide reductase [Abditibacteriota bacterium]|nr:TlpA family protein disulfide reductase [Abditibacteriota bacterium]